MGCYQCCCWQALRACQGWYFAPIFAAMSQNCGGIRSSLIPGALVAILALVSVTAPASAASRDTRERTARKACLKGDYTKGVDILTDLFVETKDPTYIFNQGRCFEQNRRYEDAVGRFEEYLRVPDANLSSEDRALAEKHIADCKDKLPRERADSVNQPPPQPLLPQAPSSASPANDVRASGPAPESATPAVAEPVSLPVRTERSTGLLAAGIVTGAVGVGAVVTGLLLNLKVNQMATDMQSKPGDYSTARENDQKSYKTLSMVGYGVGAVCVAAGAVLIGFGARTRAIPSGDVALVPAVGVDQVGAMLTGAF